jgi:GT2 family glycosyltransferase
MAELSVIVCTHKRYDLSLNCLEFLRRQTARRDRLEIVVVDNTPVEFRQDIDWQEHGADKVIFEDESGLSRARNAGIRGSTADIIAFIDDDAEAFPEWAERILHAFATRSEALVVGGKVLASYKGHRRPAWMSTKLEGYLSCIDWGDGVAPIERGQWIVGANMAFKRRVFDEYGVFNPALGRIGHATLLSNEEIQLMARLPGGTVYYAGDAPVHHLIPADRTEQAWFRKRVFWQAVSDQLAGVGQSSTPQDYFERFATALPTVPAEYRSLRALHRVCGTAEEFERQIGMIYSFTMSAGLGLPDDAARPSIF